MPLSRSFFARDANLVAPDLIGCEIVIPGDGIVARIVETEAYRGMEDPAAHSFRGETPRTAPMFGPPGHAYVYFNYGMHWALNAVVGRRNGHAVLIRAAEILQGENVVRQRRQTGQKRLPDGPELLRGPGNLARGLNITGNDNRTDLCSPTSRVFISRRTEVVEAENILTSERIGIRVATDQHWRYTLAGSGAVSGVGKNKPEKINRKK